ncbi:decapping and exoribonuclease protein Rai1-like [Drosophila tropicalis]|uniref:decapping and exoribonuclease protein Rai1-like n=1 Tax=Drosophila tropicalis TaxID=46794 RepID=UPI0035ABD034
MMADAIHLEEIQLVNLIEYNPDTKRMQTPATIGYYRQPKESEYPLDLAKGCEHYIHRHWADHSDSPHDRVLHYLMHQENPRALIKQTDFCLNRQTMVEIVEKQKKHFEAVRFNDCIFLHLVTDEEHESAPIPQCRTYPFKARQYLFADAPDATPNTDVPVNENRQIYGVFTAKLGNFRLMYSGEISGVENTEPLGDLKDPEVLKQCRLASVKVFGGKPNWRRGRKIAHWLIQAHLSGIHQLRVALFNEDGLVTNPIDGDGRNQLDWLNRFDMAKRYQILHHFLGEVTQYVGDINCPHTIHDFTVDRQSLVYNGMRQKTNSSLTEEFISFAN